LVRNATVKKRIVESDTQLVAKIDQVYFIPSGNRKAYDYRTHFYAPNKPLGNMYFATYGFNLGVIWLLSVVMFLFLYYYQAIVNYASRITFKR
jgi:hypothetical protein